MKIIKTYYASTAPIYENVDGYTDLLPENLRQRILKISDINAKVCSLGGALLLELASKEAKEDSGKVVYTKKGKPYIPDSDFYFSISHTKSYAAICFGNVPCGCDIQVEKNVNLKIAEKVFSKKEMELISKSRDKQKDFFNVWCRKESAYKLFGENYCTETNEENCIFRDFMLKEDLHYSVYATDGEILNPLKIDFDTVF